MSGLFPSIFRGGRDLLRKQAVPQPVSLIVDSDMDSDCEDVAALELANVLMEHGECNLIAVLANAAHVVSAPCCYAVNNAFGHSSVPVGAYKGASGPAGSTFASQVRDRFGVLNETSSSYSDAATVYRQALADATDGSVVIASIGFAFNLNALLSSAADGISSLDGAELVAKKVRRICVMGGYYPSGGPESNINASISDWQAFFQACPVEVVLHGFDIGNTVLVSPPSGSDPLTDPMKYAYDLQTKTQRSAWDELCVLYAVRGCRNLFAPDGLRGTMTVNNDGTNAWSATPGLHTYIKKVVSDSTIAAVVQGIHDAG